MVVYRYQQVKGEVNMLDFFRWLYTAATCTQCIVDSMDFVENVAEGNIPGAFNAVHHLVADVKHMSDDFDA